MSRSRVEIKVILLEVFTMIAFAAGETEGALFKDRITAIPERQRKTDQLMAIADARESVLVPAIGARSRVIVWQVVPRGAMRARDSSSLCSSAVTVRFVLVFMAIGS